jgi:hypothetical protein
LQKAVTTTRAIHQFSFAASTTLAANQTVHTTLTGRVIRGKGIAYQLKVGNRKTQVIRVHAGTYVRQVPGTWSKLATPKAIVNPAGTLLALLEKMTPTGVSHPSGNTRVDGVVPAAAAKSVGIPATGAPAHAVVLIDRHGRVIAVTLRGTATAGSKVVHVSVVSRYSHFSHVKPIRHP